MNILRPLSALLSVGLHVVVLVVAMWAPTGRQVRIDLDRPVYEVSLLGAPAKAGAGSRVKPAPAPAPEPVAKVQPKPAPAAPETPPKALKKEIPKEAVALPAENATKVAAKEEPKKEEPRREASKQEEAKREEPAPKTPPASANATRATNATVKNAPDTKNATKSAQDILAEALQSARKEAGVKGGTGTSGDALQAALAEVRGSVGAGAGTGTGAGTGDGTGEGAGGGGGGGYAQQAAAIIRPNWRFPRIGSIDMVATVELTVAPNGKILAARLLQSSGRADYDASVLRAIQDTAELPPLPAGLGPKIVITFHSLE